MPATASEAHTYFATVKVADSYGKLVQKRRCTLCHAQTVTTLYATSTSTEVLLRHLRQPLPQHLADVSLQSLQPRPPRESPPSKRARTDPQPSIKNSFVT